MTYKGYLTLPKYGSIGFGPMVRKLGSLATEFLGFGGCGFALISLSSMLVQMSQSADVSVILGILCFRLW